MEKNNQSKKFSIPLSSQLLKNIAKIIGILSVIILIWGYFYAIKQVPFPKNKLPKYAQKKYQQANDSNQSGTFIVTDNNFYIKFIELELKTNAPSLKSFFYQLKKDIQNKKIIVNEAKDLYDNSQTKSLFSLAKEKVKVQIDSLKKVIEQSNYYTFYTLRQKKKLEQKLSAINEFKSQLEKVSILPTIKFPYNNSATQFQSIAGIFSQMSFKNDSTVYALLDEANPILSRGFLLKKGFKQSNIPSINFSKEKQRFEKVVSDDKKIFSEQYNEIKRDLKKQTSENRAEVRNIFYQRWFLILINFLTSITASFLLLQLFKIVRRKGLPKKSTLEIYFATNMTSLVLRWIALIIIVAGMLSITVQFFIIIFGNQMLVQLPIFGTFGLLYALFAPFQFVIATVLISWLILLESEFICFISNVYHIVYEKTYTNIK